MKKVTTLFFAAVVLFLSCNSNKPGTVKGELCYPSEYIPALNITLKNTATGKIYNLTTNLNDKNFEIKDLPEGKYIAYAYSTEMPDYGGGYTQAVPCGLTVACTNHELIEFEVKSGETTENIKICDWYGAVLPEK